MKAPGLVYSCKLLLQVDEEKEDIEIFGGNLPAYHSRYNSTKSVGNNRNKTSKK